MTTTMKRAAGELEREAKRPKRDPSSVDSTAIFNDPEQEKNATDLLTWTGSESGFISGKITMKWRHPEKQRFMMELFTLLAGTKRVEVEISGPGDAAFRQAKWELKLSQELRLSLRGVDIRKKQGSFNTNTLPIALKYADGVAIEILAMGQEPGLKIDTWFKPRLEEPSQPPSAPQDAWFLTPKDTSAPKLTISKGDLMDIDEEPSTVTLSLSPSEKRVPRSITASTKYPAPSPSPLHNIGNSLPPRQPVFSPPTPSPSSSRPVRSAAAAPAKVVHTPGLSTPKENPPRKDPSAGPTKSIRPPNTSSHQASTSKIADHTPAAVETVQPIRSRPSEAESAGRGPSPQVHAVSETRPETPEGPEPVLNRKQRKNKNRREKKKAKADHSPHGAVSSAVASTTATPDPPAAKPPSSYKRTPADSDVSILPTAASHRPPQPPAPRLDSTTTPESKPTTSHTPDCKVPPGFTPLSAVSIYGKPFSVIGVVTYITDASKPRDWTRSMRIVDPSNCVESFSSSREGFTVNCFTKTYAGWLPVAKEGDIVILNNIKLKPGDITAIGYYDKLTWAVYDPLTGTVGHSRGLTGVPYSAALDDGFGALYSPFYEHDPTDLAYCVALNEWWCRVKEKRAAEMGTIHQIGGASSHRISVGRKHLLMSDLQETGVYFDCTVEVHYSYDNGYGQPFSLYVSDYTLLPGGYTYQQDWCPPKLANYMLKIEMWDGARGHGVDMRPGEFYHLRNVRSTYSRNGHREAKLVEPKIQKLTANDADTFPHLKALLARKEAFGFLDEIVDSKLALIEEGNAGEYITCVIELLHVVEDKRFIYVTDYTSHGKISAINEPWARGLDSRVLKVLLDPDQALMMKNLVVGQYYRILSLRLQQSVTAEEFRGTIGGTGRLIHPINPKSTSEVAVWKEQLIQRKNKLAHHQTDALTERPAPRPDIPRPVDVSPPINHRKCISIKQALSPECFPTFYVRARVIDFFPFRLDDSFVRTCTKCNQLIPEKRMACFGCDDVEHKYVRIVCVLRVLIDDGNDKLKLSVSGDIPLLDGVKAVILRDDPDAARRFSERLKPLFNNLIDVHEAILMKEVKEPTGPVVTFTIDRWKDEDGELTYGLRGYEL